MTTFRHNLGSSISLLWGLGVQSRGNRSQVLMYHSIGGKAEGDKRGLYSITAKSFRNQIKILSNRSIAGQSVVVPFGSERPGTTSVTFDDGYIDNLTVAAPILSEFDIPFHVFLCPTFIESGRSGFLSRADVIELSHIDGVSLGVHGYSHRPLTALNTTEISSEMTQSRRWLEDIIQKPVTSMSYPHGAVDSGVCKTASDVGFTHAACSKFGPINKPSNLLCIPRIDVWSTDSPTSFVAKIDGKWDWMKWRT